MMNPQKGFSYADWEQQSIKESFPISIPKLI
jgi:hypothetical protein